MIRPNSVLYHCNDSDRCQRFLKSKRDMIISVENGIWLGRGMYFWDNMANAKFWMKKKKRDNPDLNYCIVKTNVFMDKLLDLTDEDICNEIGEMWEKYKSVAGIESDKNEKLGHKLNVLFRAISILEKKYYVIKVYGKYNRTPRNKLWNYNIRKDNAEPIGTVKCIYSVRNEEAIGDRELI